MIHNTRKNFAGIGAALLICAALGHSVSAQVAVANKSSNQAPPSVTGPSPQTNFRETLRAKADPRIPSYTPVKGISGDIISIESEWMDDLMKSWIEGFSKLYPTVKINSLKRTTVGAMGVEPALTAASIQLAPASREL